MTCQVVWVFVVSSAATKSQDGKASVEAANKCNTHSPTNTVKTSGINKAKKKKKRRDAQSRSIPTPAGNANVVEVEASLRGSGDDSMADTIIIETPL